MRGEQHVGFESKIDHGLFGNSYALPRFSYVDPGNATYRCQKKNANISKQFKTCLERVTPFKKYPVGAVGAIYGIVKYMSLLCMVNVAR